MYNYLIIGNGIAGLSAAGEIRKADPEGSILIVSDEDKLTYWRTRLSELISKDFTSEDILVKKENWYTENKIDQKLGVKVDKIDPDKKVAILSDGSEEEFGKVLLATGARAFLPPITNIDAEGVFAIRTSDDLVAFKDYVEDKEKLVVIGGGILGLEAAYSAKNAGLDVTVIESFDYLLARQLDKETSAILEEKLNGEGLNTITGKNTSEIITEDGKVKGIKLDDGEEIEADAILVQTGVRSNINAAKESNLATDRGIIVKDNLQSEEYPFIYSAGDCAQIGNFTIGLWTASQEMGKIAGANMTGSEETYQKPKPFSTLLLGPIKLFSAGANSGEGIEEEKVDKDGKIYKLFKKGDDYVGGILCNDISYQNDIKDIVFNGKDLSETKLGKEIFAK